MRNPKSLKSWFPYRQLFFSGYFKDFSFSFSFVCSSLNRMCLAIELFKFFCLGFTVFESVILCLLPNLGKFQPLLLFLKPERKGFSFSYFCLCQDAVLEIKLSLGPSQKTKEEKKKKKKRNPWISCTSCSGFLPQYACYHLLFRVL